MSSIGKWQISTPQGANTLEPISMKPGVVEYVRDPPQTTLLGVAQRGGLRTLSVIGVGMRRSRGEESTTAP